MSSAPNAPQLIRVKEGRVDDLSDRTVVGVVRGLIDAMSAYPNATLYYQDDSGIRVIQVTRIGALVLTDAKLPISQLFEAVKDRREPARSPEQIADPAVRSNDG